MKKWISLFFLTLLVSFGGMHVSASEMKIHVIPLMDQKGKMCSHGDSVLVESKGQYLLMDTGLDTSYQTVFKYLQKQKIKKLKIYISHLHSDHVGGLLPLMMQNKLKITELYLPDKKIGGNYTSMKLIYSQIESFAKRKGIKVRYLKKDSKFTLGDVTVNVIGPVSVKGGDPLSDSNILNNNSLCAMCKCGNVRYLTMGDCEEYAEKRLVEKYGKYLKADIMKLSHHGKKTGMSEKIFKYVKPSYIFASNDKISDKMKKLASKYGKLKVTGQVKKVILYTVKNGKIKMSY